MPFAVPRPLSSPTRKQEFASRDPNPYPVNARSFLARVRNLSFYQEQICHARTIAERDAQFAEVPGGLHPSVAAALADAGISDLYRHQATAISHVRAGASVVVVTGTASGKTLCYNIPAVERLLVEPMSTMLYLFPTKALAQDQLRGLGIFERGGIKVAAGCYDGDTPGSLRRKLRDNGSIILTNPDMLHQGILPNHARWNRFFTHLKYVVVDEVHAYRGVFGSHLTNVMRRLRRICAHYGASPQFICCSATIGNPGEHASAVTGVPMTTVDDDGSPRGPKQFALWNPPPIETAAFGDPTKWRVGGDRRSSLGEATHLLATLVKEGVQTIAFVRTRLAAELISRGARDELRAYSPRLAKTVEAYRGGYLPEERREIERRLAAREILGVASTNALELGIDIGSLDACILVGYPGTVASLWQQAGRAGRGKDEALVFLIGQNTPIDQYLMSHDSYLFGRNPEQAVVDPDNPHIVIGHLKCAAQELGLPDAEVADFGPFAPVLLELLEEDGYLKHITDRWYYTSSDHPAADTRLRNISGPVYTIQDEAAAERVIGTMDEVSALSQLHTHAVYLHQGDTYFVNRLDFEQKIAFVERRDLDYYTQSNPVSDLRLDEVEERQEWRAGETGFGDVTVTTTIPMFKKIKFGTRESLGYEELELPPQRLETVACWMAPPPDLVQRMQDASMIVGEALIGIANVLVEVAPIFVMCDSSDIGVVVNSACLGRDALFIHDKYPGGMGYARRCLDRLEDMLKVARTVVEECSCEDGCPSCVGSALPAIGVGDLDTAVRGRIPDKAAARWLLGLWLQEARQ